MVASVSKRSRWFRGIALAALGVIACVGAAGGVVAHRVLPAEGEPIHGLFLGGRVVAGAAHFGSWVEDRRVQEAARSVTIVHKDLLWRIPVGELGIEVDVGKTMTEALKPGRAGRASERLHAMLAARRAETDIPLAFAIDTRKAEAALAAVAPEVRREPVNASMNLDRHERVPAIPGEELDVQATVNAILDGFSAGQDVFKVVTRSVPAGVTTDDLGHVDITQVVASYETHFSLHGVGTNRGINIAAAARSMDGTVLMPGQEFVFNKVVGERTLERGFAYAPEIVGDELQMGVGGGVCQVASTLYAAAIYGALEIEERWAHARPSSYTKLGLDATVFYGAKDLRFRNALPYPVLLHVYLPEPGVVRAELLGGEPVAEVEYKYGVAKSESFVRRITVKPWMTGGKVVRKQKGIKGYSVSSLVRVQYRDGRKTERWYHSEYRPTPEIFWVSPDYDEGKLPALPNGAKGVEGRGTDTARSVTGAPGAG